MSATYLQTTASPSCPTSRCRTRKESTVQALGQTVFVMFEKYKCSGFLQARAIELDSYDIEWAKS